ncbi:MAG: VanW family protein [Haloechinothrix sp.]
MPADGPHKPAADAPPESEHASATPWWRRGKLVGAVAAGTLVLLYLVDLAVTGGEVPRDVLVAGIAVGGLDRASAEQKLRQGIQPRLHRQAQVIASGHRIRIDPADAQIRVDWNTTLDHATERSLNPLQRLVAFPVRSTPEGVRAALESFAIPAVSAPVSIKGQGVEGSLSPAAIGSVLEFVPGDEGGLVPHIPRSNLKAAIGKDLAETETKSRDARIAFGKKKATVKPSVDGLEIDWDATAAKLLEVLPRSDGRVVEVPYLHTPAKLTEAELSDLGIKEVIGEFTTSNFAEDSGINIRNVAKEVHGAIVRPGETFSLNGYTGRRGREQGYVAAAVIESGELSRAVGGGISQFATTLYNAAYFAAMVDVEHSEHSFYISRYPVAREATVFQNPDGSSVIDLKFRNDSKTGAAVQTIWTPEDITVRLWGVGIHRDRHQSDSRPERQGDQQEDPHGLLPSTGSHPVRAAAGQAETHNRDVPAAQRLRITEAVAGSSGENRRGETPGRLIKELGRPPHHRARP